MFSIESKLLFHHRESVFFVAKLKGYRARRFQKWLKGAMRGGGRGRASNRLNGECRSCRAAFRDFRLPDFARRQRDPLCVPLRAESRAPKLILNVRRDFAICILLTPRVIFAGGLEKKGAEPRVGRSAEGGRVRNGLPGVLSRRHGGINDRSKAPRDFVFALTPARCARARGCVRY